MIDSQANAEEAATDEFASTGPASKSDERTVPLYECFIHGETIRPTAYRWPLNLIEKGMICPSPGCRLRLDKVGTATLRRSEAPR